MGGIFPPTSAAVRRKDGAARLQETLLLAPHADELLWAHGAVPRHGEILAFAGAAITRRMHESPQAGEHGSVGSGVLCERRVALKRLRPKRRALAVVSC